MHINKQMIEVFYFFPFFITRNNNNLISGAYDWIISMSNMLDGRDESINKYIKIIRYNNNNNNSEHL